jgi:hypothetical protein
MCRIRLPASKFVQYFLKRTLCVVRECRFRGRESRFRGPASFVQYFLKRTLCMICRRPFVNRMALVRALLDDFEALVRESRFRGREMSISRSRNVILKVHKFFLESTTLTFALQNTIASFTSVCQVAARSIDKQIRTRMRDYPCGGLNYR